MHDIEDQPEITASDARSRGRLAALLGSRALSAWSSLPFRRYFWVQALAMAGRALQTTLIGYIVYDLTGSGFLLGLVSFMQMVPQLVLAPIVGVIVDRFDRRHILAVQLAVQATGLLLLAVLSITGQLTVPAIAATVVVMGIANAFSYPASSSLLPSLVPMTSLQSANAVNMMVANLARIATPIFSGILVDASGFTAALLLGTGIYAPAAVLVLTVPLLVTAARVSTGTAPIELATSPSVRRDLTDAIAYIRENPPLRAALVNDIVPYLFGMAHIALLPAVASDTLDGGASMLGILFGAGGVGAIFGTLVAGALTGRGHRGRAIWLSMSGFGSGLLVVASGESFAIVLAGLFITGFFQMFYVVQNDTLVQTFAEDRFRGRALAAQSMVNGLMPVGFLLLGTIAEFASLRVAFGTSGVALVTAGLVTVLFRPAMRDLD